MVTFGCRLSAPVVLPVFRCEDCALDGNGAHGFTHDGGVKSAGRQLCRVVVLPNTINRGHCVNHVLINHVRIACIARIVVCLDCVNDCVRHCAIPFCLRGRVRCFGCVLNLL